MRLTPWRADGLGAAAGAVTLGVLFWFLCTPRSVRWLLDGISEDVPPRSDVRFGLAEWIGPWTREELTASTELVYWLDSMPEWAGPVTVLTVALFGLATVWALRSLPPTSRTWPLTLAACWALSIAAQLVASGVLAPLSAWEGASLADAVAGFTGRGAWLAAVFGLPAAVVAVTAAGTLRVAARRGGTVAPVAARPPVPRRPALLATGAVGGVTALAIAALGNTWVYTWVLRLDAEEPGALGSAWAVVRWTMPGIWTADPQHYASIPSEGLLLFLALLQPLLAGGLFWSALHRIPRRTVSAVLLVAACAAVLAGVATGLAGTLLAESAMGLEPSVFSKLAVSLQYTSGALTMGLLGGLAAGLLLRRLEGRPPQEPVAEPGPEPEDGGDGGDGGGGEFGGPDDELVITVSR